MYVMPPPTSAIPLPETTDPHIAASIYRTSAQQRLQTLLRTREVNDSALQSTATRLWEDFYADVTEAFACDGPRLAATTPDGEQALVTTSAVRVLRRYGLALTAAIAEHATTQAKIDSALARCRNTMPDRHPATVTTTTTQVPAQRPALQVVQP